MSTAIHSPRWRLWLAVSLALNLALLVAIVLPWFGWRASPLARMPFAGLAIPGPQELRESLPAERRALVEAVLAQHRSGIRERMRAAHEARLHLDVLLRDERLDPVALEAGFAALREQEVAVAGAVHAMLADLMLQLDPAERRALADGMARRMFRHGRGHPRHGSEDPAGEATESPAPPPP